MRIYESCAKLPPPHKFLGDEGTGISGGEVSAPPKERLNRNAFIGPENVFSEGTGINGCGKSLDEGPGFTGCGKTLQRAGKQHLRG